MKHNSGKVPLVPDPLLQVLSKVDKFGPHMAKRKFCLTTVPAKN